MCRYAISGPHKCHYACFSCRKAFKQPPIDDYFASRGQNRNAYAELAEVWRTGDKYELQRRESVLKARLEELEGEYRAAVRKCPECGEPMVDMGLDFKAPRQADAKAWRIVQGMCKTGHAFHTCGCVGPGWIPQSSSDYSAYLEKYKSIYSNELRFVQNRQDLANERKKEAAEYWATRIEAIELEISRT